MMKLNVSFKGVLSAAALISAVLLTACSSAPRGLAHKAYRPAAEPVLTVQDLQTAAFASQVASMRAGSELEYAQSPLGSSMRVRALNFYTNGLGEQCRKAEGLMQNYNSSNALPLEFAVCRQTDGSWRYVKPLLCSSGE